MKYSESEYLVDAKFDRDQRRKISDFIKKTGTKSALLSTLITTYGVIPNAYSEEIQSVITADELFCQVNYGESIISKKYEAIGESEKLGKIELIILIGGETFGIECIYIICNKTSKSMNK